MFGLLQHLFGNMYSTFFCTSVSTTYNFNVAIEQFHVAMLSTSAQSLPFTDDELKKAKNTAGDRPWMVQ